MAKAARIDVSPPPPTFVFRLELTPEEAQEVYDLCNVPEWRSIETPRYRVFKALYDLGFRCANNYGSTVHPVSR